MNERKMPMGTAVACIVGCALMSSAAQADLVPMSHSYGFTRITDNGTEDPASQFVFEVRNYSGGEADGPAFAEFATAQWVSVLVRNTAGGISSSIGETYFEDGTLLDLSTVVSGPGTDYVTGANPGNLPGGEPYNFNATQIFSAESSPGNANGINPGEWVELLFTLQGTYDYDDVLAAIATGLEYTRNGHKQYPDELSLRFGMHVRSIGLDGESEGFLNINTIPLPAPLGLAIAGLAGVFVMARRGRKAGALVI